MEEEKNNSKSVSHEGEVVRAPRNPSECEGEVAVQLKKELEETQKQRDEYLAGWQRAKADFLNYKKEEAERLKEWEEYRRAAFLRGLLPTLDNLELAERELSDEAKATPAAQGFLHIAKQLKDFLKSQGVEELQAEGAMFDSSLHEAIEEAEVEGKTPGTVLEVLEKGYMLGGKLLRPAKVKVAR